MKSTPSLRFLLVAHKSQLATRGPDSVIGCCFFLPIIFANLAFASNSPLLTGQYNFVL